MTDRTLSIEQLLDILQQNPQRIAEFTAPLTPGQLHAAPEPGAWSVNEVLAHLRACADRWGSAIETMLAQDKPTIRAINPRTWIEQTDYREQKFAPSFQAFTKQRNHLLKTLEALPKKSWARSAIITGAGKPLERTVFFYAHWLATHERTHVKQIKRITEALKN